MTNYMEEDILDSAVEKLANMNKYAGIGNFLLGAGGLALTGLGSAVGAGNLLWNTGKAINNAVVPAGWTGGLKNNAKGWWSNLKGIAQGGLDTAKTVGNVVKGGVGLGVGAAKGYGRLVKHAPLAVPALTVAGGWMLNKAMSKPAPPPGLFSKLSPMQQGALMTAGTLGLGAAGMHLYNRFKGRDQQGQQGQQGQPMYAMPYKQGSYNPDNPFIKKADFTAGDLDQLENMVKYMKEGKGSYDDIKWVTGMVDKINSSSIKPEFKGRANMLLRESDVALDTLRTNKARNFGRVASTLGLLAAPIGAAAAATPGLGAVIAGVGASGIAGAGLGAASAGGELLDKAIQASSDFIKHLGKPKTVYGDVVDSINNRLGKIDPVTRGLIFGGAGLLSGIGLMGNEE